MGAPTAAASTATRTSDVSAGGGGGGGGGGERARARRARDAEARITLVSTEHDHFFSRPALMYVFAGQTSLRDTEPYDRGLYERMRFERRSAPVARLERAG